MKTVKTISLLFILTNLSIAQNLSIGANIGHVRFMDTWVSGIKSEVFLKSTFKKYFFFDMGLGRASGFDTYYNENNNIPENQTYFSNINNYAFLGLGLNVIQKKRHELKVKPQVTANNFLEYSNYQTLRNQAIYDEGNTIGYGYTVDYLYKLKKIGFGFSVSYNRYGDYRLRGQNIQFVYFLGNIKTQKSK